MKDFCAQLQDGQIGEGYIARWLRRRGWNILPVYEKEIENGKGPRLFMAETCAHEELIAPDLFAIKNGKFAWIEAKHKTRFSWYGVKRRWVTGIDKIHFNNYIQVQIETDIPVWLMFLHTESITWAVDIERWGAPDICPTGLYGEKIDFLATDRAISHESNKYGPTGMIYWADTTLKKIAELPDVLCRKDACFGILSQHKTSPHIHHASNSHQEHHHSNPR